MSRKVNIHPVDRFCRDIINRYPQSLEAADMFYRDRTIVTGECPDWCALPMKHIIKCIAGTGGFQAIMKVLKQGIAASLTAALIWSRSKMVYRFDNTLFDTITAMHLDGKIPFDILDCLPYQCVYIERDMTIDGHKTIGFFAWLDWGIIENTKFLVLLFVKTDSDPLMLCIPVSGGTIKESILDMANLPSNTGIARHKYTEDDVNSSASTQPLIECVNLLLYLCSEKPDMPDDTELKTRRSRESNGNPKRAATWEIGTRIGAALRKAMDAQAKDETEPNGRPHSTPRPHMRRAHWHSFWTGKRGSAERKLILRWLPPMAINIDGAELPTVVTPVKIENGGAL